MKRLAPSRLIIVYSIIKRIALLSSRVTDLRFFQAFVYFNNVSIAGTHEIITDFLLLLHYFQWHSCSSYPKYLELIFAGSMKGLTTSSVEDVRKKFLSLAADIFPHYFISASQAFLVTLTVLPDLVSLHL